MTSPWQRNWSEFRNDAIERADREDMKKAIKWLGCTVLLAIIIGVIVFAFFDAAVKEATNDIKYGQWKYVVQYDKPQAFHKSYPTWQQMESLHALQTLQRGKSGGY